MTDPKPTSLFRQISIPVLVMPRPQSAIDEDMKLNKTRHMFAVNLVKPQLNIIERRKRRTLNGDN